MEHSTAKLVRALVLRYVNNLSLRETENQLHYHLLSKWFCGYSIFEPGPDHSQLHRFEKWVMDNHPRAFFDTFLNQIDNDVPQARTAIEMGDTFAMLANATLEGLTRRLRHGSRRLLVVFKKEDPVGYELVQAELDQASLFGRPAERSGYRLSEEERQQRRIRTAQAVVGLLALVRSQDGGQKVAEWLGWLEKILTDEFHLQQDEQGGLTVVGVRSQKERGRYPVHSATDPEATLRNHGANKTDFGFNVSVAANELFIREIQAATGSQPDPVDIPDLLANQLTYHDYAPEKFLYDQIAGTGKAAAQVHQATQGQTQLVAKPLKEIQSSQKLGPQHCTLSDDQRTLTCPVGRVSSRQYRSGSGDGFIFRFSAPVCTGCRLLRQCRGSAKSPTSHRDFFISDHRLFLERLVAYSQTETFKQEMKRRPQIERVIAGLVRYNGARQARFRGLAKVDYQAKMSAMAYNLKRWATLHTLRATCPADQSIPARGSPQLALPALTVA